MQRLQPARRNRRRRPSRLRVTASRKVSTANDSVAMGAACRHSIQAGRAGYFSGVMTKQDSSQFHNADRRTTHFID
jgi:thiazole synthase ThiGH ThiG subunit